MGANRAVSPGVERRTKLGHRQVLDALLFVAENCYASRSLPTSVGNWHTIHVRLALDQGAVRRQLPAPAWTHRHLPFDLRAG